jgi:hypothetical protein
MILGLGRSWLVPEPALQKLARGIHAGERPSEPDFVLLRARSDDVLQAATALVLADGKVKPEETELLKKVRLALAG